MKCNNCGAEINEKDSTCKVCGSTISKEENGPQILLNSKASDEGINEDSLLLDIFIGHNKEALKKGDFSVWAFLFGPLYMMYRKMIILTLSYLILYYVLYLYLDEALFIVMFIFHVFLGISFKKIYIKRASDKVVNIRSKNINKTRDQIIDKCKKKGGTSILYIGIFFIILSITTTYIPRYANTSIYVEDLKVKIPNSFEAGTENSSSYQTYRLNEENNCSVVIQTKDNIPDDVDVYLKNNVYKSDKDSISSMKTEEINDILWYKVEVNSLYGKSFYFATKKVNKLYLVEFDTFGENKKCDNAKNIISKSLKLKED